MENKIKKVKINIIKKKKFLKMPRILNPNFNSTLRKDPDSKICLVLSVQTHTQLAKCRQIFPA